MAGRVIRIYLSDEDAMLWDYAIGLLGRDRTKRLIVKFIRGQFADLLKKEAASPERQAEAKEVVRELAAKRDAARKRSKQSKEKARETA